MNYKVDILPKIKDVFVLPKRKYYLGEMLYGTPYFFARNHLATIISIKKLIPKTQEQLDKTRKNLGNSKDGILKFEFTFSNLPVVRRNKFWIKNIFGKYYYIRIGYPLTVRKVDLGWKDKFKTPRFEWAPSFQINFFGWQFHTWLHADDDYWEQVLWYIFYSDCDIIKAKETWGWSDMDGNSSWDNKYLK